MLKVLNLRYDSTFEFYDAMWTWFMQIFDMSAVVRNACISGDLATAEQLLTEEIDASGNNHHSYANRSAVRARKTDWDGALKDATKVRSTDLVHHHPLR